MRENMVKIKPVPGETYLYVTSPAGPGASISLDFDKLLFESLTKRGRAIKHNRTHATAWKKYASYISPSKTMPALKNISQDKQRKRQLTAYSPGTMNRFFFNGDYIYPDNDSLKLEAPELTPAFQPVPLLPIYSAQPDSVKQQTAEKKKEKQEKKTKAKASQPEAIPDYQRYIQATRSRRPSAGMNFQEETRVTAMHTMRFKRGVCVNNRIKTPSSKKPKGAP